MVIEDRWLSVEEICKYLGVSNDTVYKWIDKHDMPAYRMQSMGRDELLVIMPADDRIVRDILMYKRTEKYIRQNISITQQDSVKKILTDKSSQNRERYGEIRQRVLMLIGKAKLVINGGDFEVGTENPESKIVSGFYELLIRSYPNLRMLRGIKYTENDIRTCLQQAGDGLFGNDGMNIGTLNQNTSKMLCIASKVSGNWWDSRSPWRLVRSREKS